MNNNRIWVIGTVLAAIAILILGWFLGVSPKLDELNKAKASTVQQNTSNLAATTRLAQLQKENEGLDALKANLATLRASIPASADYTGFLDELNNLAGANGAVLLSYVPSAPQIITAASPAAAVPAAGATSVAPVAPGTAPADGTLVAIPTDLSATGSFDHLLGFLDGLQHSKRLFLVGSLSFGQGAAGFTLNVSGIAYVQIDSSVTAPKDAVSGAVPGAPTSTVAPTAPATTAP